MTDTPPTGESGPAAEVLIVEDSRTQAVLLRHLLQSRGYGVAVAGDGAAALAAARARKPALVVSDVDMPVMGGYEMCRALKDDPRLADVPVILLTSLSEASDVLRGLEAAADYYLTKPYDDADLLSTVRSALANPAGCAGAAGSDGTGNADGPLEAVFEGRRHVFTAGRRQVLTLLLSTYGNAVRRNRDLVRAQQELRKVNTELTEQTRKLREGEERLRQQNQRLEEIARSEREAHEALKRAQGHLVQSEKMAGLGQMVAGVAHEINNPLAFALNNLAVLQRDLAAVRRVVELYQEAASPDPGAAPRRPELLQEIQDLSEQLDLSYTLPNLQDLLASSRDGLKRIQQIVLDLREFARLDESDRSDVDLNAAITSTVNVTRNRAAEKGVRVELELSPLPPVTCYPAKINQVVMNLVNNAVDASRAGDKVVVRTAAAGAGANPGLDAGVKIEVADTGTGIDPAIRDRIFDPFFTTKPPGKGTGLGLSTSYGIVQDHGGTIQVQSTPGKGATFTVLLPSGKPMT